MDKIETVKEDDVTLSFKENTVYISGKYCSNKTGTLYARFLYRTTSICIRK